MSTGLLCGLHSDYTELKECILRKLNTLEQRNRTRTSHINMHPFPPFYMHVISHKMQLHYRKGSLFFVILLIDISASGCKYDAAVVGKSRLFAVVKSRLLQQNIVHVHTLRK